MSDYETPLFRDLNKFMMYVGIAFLIALVSFYIIFYAIPAYQYHINFIETNSCIYFEDIQKTLCGQDAINQINSKQFQITVREN